MNMKELIDTCHGASKAAGWWHDIGNGLPLDPLTLAAEKIALCHSEVSEAHAANIKGSMDDKLTDRLGYEVELADVVIRCADLLGALGEATFEDDDYGLDASCFGTMESLLDIHANLSEALEALRKGGSPSKGLTHAIKRCLGLAFDSGGRQVDVMSAVHAKLAFNKQRAIDGDHSLEARRAKGGKKW